MSIEFLPPEILVDIFKRISPQDRKNVRLACRSLYHSCHPIKEQKMRLRIAHSAEEVNYIQNILESYGFAEFNLEFQDFNTNLFTKSFWELCGRKIYSLDLYKCRLGDETVRNLILCCKNVQQLRFHILLDLKDQAFCRFMTLEEIVENKFVNRRVKTLEMNWYTSDSEKPFLSTTIIEKWRRICDALYRIYPSVVNFTAGHYRRNTIHSKCSFSRSSNEIDETLITPVFSNLAFSIFKCDERMLRLLDALCPLRLTKFELVLCDRMYRKEYQDIIKDFFSNHTELKSLQMEFPDVPDAAFRTTLFFHILTTCDNLDELEYPFSRDYLTYAAFSPNYTAILSSDIELIWYQHKMEKLKYLSVGMFAFFPSTPDGILSLMVRPCPLLATFVRLERLNINGLCAKQLNIHNLTLLQQLTLHLFGTTHDILQIIFRFLTDLKILILHLYEGEFTDFSFTGRRKYFQNEVVITVSSGYSIRNLTKLEKLKIHTNQHMLLDEESLNEFRFPNLQYFHTGSKFFSMFAQEALIRIAVGMPRLRVITFTSENDEDPFIKAKVLTPRNVEFDYAAEFLVKFCDLSRNLYYLNFDSAPLHLCDIENLFRVSTSLRYITCGSCTFQYDLPTKKIEVSPCYYVRI